MFHTSSNPTSGEFWAAHFYGTGVTRQSGYFPVGLVVRESAQRTQKSLDFGHCSFK